MSSPASLSFAAVAVPGPTGASWVEEVRRLEDFGYGVVLTPDTRWTASPFPALAAAAAVTTHLRLRTWVLASPLRTAQAVAREARALQQLSDGRFELGLGTGRPDAADDAAALGVSWPDAGARIGLVEEVATLVRDSVRPAPKVIVAAAGPKALAAAGRVADRVAVPLFPTATRADLDDAVARVRAAAPRAALSLQVVGMGETLSSFVARQGFTAESLREQGAVGVLPGDSDDAADVLAGWAHDTGADEVVVPGELASDLAPVLERLRP